ncbi:Uma2 family endonuclease [Geminocystis sp. CENA526]|uniref:Uma2 family endonuclease n=1 Tax=Geminocystis sp. CENA526 TaxID=1355871 RepID=UPI003D6FAD9B
MTIATEKMSFEDYLQYHDETDRNYELVDGELISMSLGTGKHGALAKFLERIFDDEISNNKLSWTAQKFAVGVRSPRGRRWDTSRIPDVTVLPLEQWENLANKEAVIDFNETPPILVVEVVSPSTRKTDYRSKRTEYAVLEISEYWIVDPDEKIVTICTLMDSFYDANIFQDEELIISPTFPSLQLTPKQIFG